MINVENGGLMCHCINNMRDRGHSVVIPLDIVQSFRKPLVSVKIGFIGVGAHMERRDSEDV